MSSRARKMLELAINNLNDKEELESKIHPQHIENEVEHISASNLKLSGISPTISNKISYSMDCSETENNLTDIEPFSGSSSECFRPSETESSSVSSSPCSPITPRNSKRTLHPKLDTPSDQILRKRQKRTFQWRKNKAKVLKSQGKQYYNSKGVLKAEKVLKKGCGDFCRMKCSEKVPEENRKHIFQYFYNIGNQDLQRSYISQLITFHQKKVCRNSDNSRKTESRKYFLSFFKDGKEVKEAVCKPMFLNTLAITNQTIETVVRNKHSNPLNLSPDKRGKHTKSNVKNIKIKEIVKQHISAFPLVESHYCRQESRKMYLGGDISSIAQMYRLYDQWFSENNHDLKLKATIRQYRDTFHDSFDISFYIPKKDQCDLCEKCKNLNEEEKKAIETDINQHLFSKQKSRELKSIEKQESCDNKNVVTACFDFQKILSSPCAEVSTFYYKRKLHAYNFTIFKLSSKQASCFVWDESIAKKGATEVATCLHQFVTTENKNNGVTKFNFWSDNCGGQNKNKIVFSFYVWASFKLDIDISHKFLEKGHTQNEGDSVHALIEKSKKNKRLYTPHEWFSLIRNAKKNDPLYNVIEMENEDFLDFKQLSSALQWSKNTINEKVSLSKIRDIRVYKEKNYRLFYKYQFDEDFKEIKLYDETKRRRNTNFLPQDIPRAYTSTFPITEAKHKDLLYLCDQNQIPKFYQNFYRNLKSVAGDEYVVNSECGD